MTYNKRDFHRILKSNGYVLQPNRGKGSHSVYSNGTRVLSIGDSYNKMVIRRLIKEYDLTV